MFFFLISENVYLGVFAGGSLGVYSLAGSFFSDDLYRSVKARALTLAVHPEIFHAAPESLQSQHFFLYVLKRMEALFPSTALRH